MGTEIKNENLLENYLKWGKKVDFSSFKDYMNRNIVARFDMKERYEIQDIKQIIKGNIKMGIKHYAKENNLFLPFFKKMFYYDEQNMRLFLIGKYKGIDIKFLLGEVHISLKRNRIMKRKKMLDFPKFTMTNYDDKTIILLCDFIKWVINRTLENRALQTDNNIKAIDDLRKKYENEKKLYESLKIS